MTTGLGKSGSVEQGREFAAPAARPPRRRLSRLVRLLLVTAAVTAALYLARPWWLPALAWPLIEDVSCDAPDAVVLIDGDAVAPEAARYADGRPELRVLVMQPRPSRLVRLGIVPPRERVARA